MASKEELKRQDQINAAKQEEIRLEKELTAARQRSNAVKEDDLGISSGIIEVLKESVGIKSKVNQFDSNLLSVNKKINKEILNQKTGLNDIKSLDKQILANEEAILKAEKVKNSLRTNIGKQGRVEVANVKATLTNMSKLQKEREAILEAAEGGEKFDEKRLSSIEKELKTRNATLDRQVEGLSTAQQQALFTEQNLKLLEEENKKRLAQKKAIEDAESKLGIFGGVLKGISKIPLLGDVIDAEEALEAAKEATMKTGSGLAGMAAGAKVLGAQLLNAFKPANIAAAVFTAIVKTVTMLDKTSGEVAKNLNMTVGEARDLQRSFASLSSGELKSSLVSSQGLLESLQEINKTLGTNVMLNQEDLITFTKLREAAGFTNEELMGIQSLTLANGQSLKENTGEFLAQAKVSAMQNGVLLNEKELLKDIANVSAATTLSFGKNPALIADAVASAKALGMELDQVEAIADSLLDFESSIANELEAELLLGKDINLEKARQAALDNDLATLAKEISTQVGSSAEFSKMNRIQQDALAKSLGMSREDIAQTLFVQEQLAGATGEEAERRQAILDKRIEEVGLAQAQKEIAKDGLSTLEDQASVSERFEKTIKKVLDSFMGIAGVVMEIVEPVVNILLPVFNGIAAAVKLMLDGLTLILPVLGGIVTILGLVFAKSIATAIVDIASNAYKNFSFMGPAGFALATAATLAGAGMLKRLATADDMISSPTRRPGYGDRTLFGPEGAISLNNKDTIIAGTNLFPRGNDVVSSPAGTVAMNDNSKTNALLATLVQQNNKKPQISPVGLYSVQ